MKRVLFLYGCVVVLMAACGKKEAKQKEIEQSAITAKSTACENEVITRQPTKVFGTDILLPVGSKICISKDKVEGRVELPKGYVFIAGNEDDRVSPVYASYSCTCSESKTACQVFFAQDMGFGCLQNTCTGTCTGKFTVNGNLVHKVVSTNEKLTFFSEPAVQKNIWEKCGTIAFPAEGTNLSELVYVKQWAFGQAYYLLLNKSNIPPSLQGAEILSSKASCACKTKQFCKLLTVDLPMLKGAKIKIYFCDGSCSSCELTVD